MPDFIPPSIEEQKKMGTLQPDPEGFAPEDEAFLHQIMALLDSGKIRLMEPASLMNQPAFDALSPEKQSKAEVDAVALLAKLRDIAALYRQNPSPTFALKNLVASVRLTKERIEALGGDIFVM